MPTRIGIFHNVQSQVCEIVDRCLPQQRFVFHSITESGRGNLQTEPSTERPISVVRVCAATTRKLPIRFGYGNVHDEVVADPLIRWARLAASGAETESGISAYQPA